MSKSRDRRAERAPAHHLPGTEILTVLSHGDQGERQVVNRAYSASVVMKISAMSAGEVRRDGVMGCVTSVRVKAKMKMKIIGKGGYRSGIIIEVTPHEGSRNKRLPCDLKGKIDCKKKSVNV